MNTLRNKFALTLAGLALLVLAAPAAHAVVETGLTARSFSTLQCESIAPDQPCTINLSAGADEVASVTATQSGTTLTVTFTAIAPWELTQVAASVSTAPPDAGDPVQCSVAPSDPATATCELTVPKGAKPGDCLYFRAGAEVAQDLGAPNLGDFAAALPDQVTMQVAFPGSAGSPSYLDTTVTNGGILSGTYDGWCVDVDRGISEGPLYNAKVYSSYEALPAGAVDKPDEFDKVNWILNQDYVGRTASCGGVFTYGDVQRAIWAVIDNAQSTAGLGTWTQCHVDQILAEAAATGGGFTPACGDVIAVVLLPIDANGVITKQVIIAQVTVITVPTSCRETRETVQACFQCCLDGEIIVEKITDPKGSDQSFEFVPSWGASFDLKDGESNASGFLAADNYSVSESVPDGWDLTSSVCYSNAPGAGDTKIDPSAIKLGKGEVITCTFTNTQLGSLEVTKTVSIVAGTPTTTSFEICVAGPAPKTDSTCKSFTAGQTQTWTNLVPGEYTVSESTIAESGWTVLVTGSPATVPAGGVASAAVTNTFEDRDEGCTRTIGYWQTHSKYGPAKYDATWAEIGEDTAFFFSGQTWIQVIKAPTKGNAYYILGQQYIGARLNVEAGASVPADVQAALAAATALFSNAANTPTYVAALKGAARQAWINLATTLDNYNNGLISPGHCN